MHAKKWTLLQQLYSSDNTLFCTSIYFYHLLRFMTIYITKSQTWMLKFRFCGSVPNHQMRTIRFSLTISRYMRSPIILLSQQWVLCPQTPFNVTSMSCTIPPHLGDCSWMRRSVLSSTFLGRKPTWNLLHTPLTVSPSLKLSPPLTLEFSSILDWNSTDISGQFPKKRVALLTVFWSPLYVVLNVSCSSYWLPISVRW